MTATLTATATDVHPATCPAPDNPHTHATVNKRCKGRFGTCNKLVVVDVWRYIIGVDRLRQMGTARCESCFHTTYVVGDVGTPNQHWHDANNSDRCTADCVVAI